MAFNLFGLKIGEDTTAQAGSSLFGSAGNVIQKTSKTYAPVTTTNKSYQSTSSNVYSPSVQYIINSAGANTTQTPNSSSYPTANLTPTSNVAPSASASTSGSDSISEPSSLVGFNGGTGLILIAGIALLGGTYILSRGKKK